jgi:RHS repeat-associated protein
MGSLDSKWNFFCCWCLCHNSWRWLSIELVEGGEGVKVSGVSEIASASDSSPQHSALSSQSLSAEGLDPIYTYDLNGNRTSMIDPTGLTTYAYDTLNRLTSITNNKGQTTNFAYDALGRRTSMTHANGVVTNYSYDAASQLLSLVHQLGATTVNSFSYTYDKVGNRKSKTNRDGAHNYTYDTLNRLVDALNPLPSNPQESYVYDSVGNRTTSNQNGASTFNTANQLLEDSNFTYQYDNNGNMTRKTAKIGGAITTYEYDAENKLVRVVSPTNTANYKYDGLGRRVEKEVIAGSTTTTRYVYDNEDILLELNGSNAIVARYTHGPGIDEPLIMEKNNQSFYYHADGLGSITELTNQSGTVAQRYAYSSFGKIESQLDPSFVQPYTYTSREFDPETGLYYYRARAYDSATGRFLQEDPIGLQGGINRYLMAANNPINWNDPLGLYWEYSQSLGTMIHFLPNTNIAMLSGNGYSGIGKGLNNPDYEFVRNVGPIPQGTYDIGPIGTHYSERGTRLDESMSLTPRQSRNAMFQRYGFAIHGGNMTNRTSSNGCIVLPVEIRREIAASGDHELRVVR